MIFSHRFRQILADGRLQLDVPEQARSKIWAQLLRYDSSIRVQPDRGDTWERNSSYLQETGDELKREYGWAIGESWPEVDTEKCRREGPGLGPFLLGCDAASLFDFIQIFVRFLDPDERIAFQAKVNGIFELEGLCWRLAGDDFLTGCGNRRRECAPDVRWN